jgi:hypothetical protein
MGRAVRPREIRAAAEKKQIPLFPVAPDRRKRDDPRAIEPSSSHFLVRPAVVPVQCRPTLELFCKFPSRLPVLPALFFFFLLSFQPVASPSHPHCLFLRQSTKKAAYQHAIVLPAAQQTTCRLLSIPATCCCCCYSCSDNPPRSWLPVWPNRLEQDFTPSQFVTPNCKPSPSLLNWPPKTPQFFFLPPHARTLRSRGCWSGCRSKADGGCQDRQRSGGSGRSALREQGTERLGKNEARLPNLLQRAYGEWLVVQPAFPSSRRIALQTYLMARVW